MEQLERQVDTEKLLAEIHELPESYREVILLFYYGDYSYRDLADMLDVSAATINARLTKARALLRHRTACREDRR